MANTVSSSQSVKTSPVHVSSAPGSYSGNPSLTYTSTLATTDISQVYSNTRTVSGTTETLDMTTGLTDAFGDAINFSHVKVIQVVNNDASATLTVGGGANALCGTDQYTIGPGKCLYIDTVFTTSGSVKNLLMTFSASGKSYSICLLGN